MFYVDHLTINAIGSHFGVHHATVARVVNQDFKRRREKGNGNQSLLLKEFIHIIEQTLEKYPKIRATRIFITLKEKGFKGSYNTVRRAVGKMRPRHHRAYVPVEVIPGEEAQVDWAHAGVIKIGRAERKLYCFVMTLSWSRASWVQLTLDMETETLLRCHAAAFEYFGGLPRRILYDNMKTVVVDRVGDLIRFNKSFLEFSTWCCFEPRVCDPYQPNQKGRVERFIQTLRDGFLNDRETVDLEETRYQLRLWLDQTNKRAWPGGSYTTVNECWDTEKNHLLNSPIAIYPKGRKEVRSGKTPLVCFDLNSYTIDPRFVRQPLVLFYDDHTVTLYAGEILVGQHERCWDREQTVKNQGHIDATYSMASSGQKTASSRTHLCDEIPEIRSVLEYCQKADLHLSGVERILLRHRTTYGRKLLGEAICEAISRGAPTPEIITQIIMRLAGISAFLKTNELTLPNRPGVRDLDVSSHDLSAYDNL